MANLFQRYLRHLGAGTWALINLASSGIFMILTMSPKGHRAAISNALPLRPLCPRQLPVCCTTLVASAHR
jgi:hypothetical protein